VDLAVKGFYSSLQNQYFKIKIDYCNQTLLDGILPGHTCRPREEADNLTADGGVIIYLMTLTSYFDQKNFKGNPIKSFLMYDDFVLKSSVNQKRVAKVLKTNVILRDSWLDFSPEEETMAVDVKITKQEEAPYNNQSLL
jgi:hypothetical protein